MAVITISRQFGAGGRTLGKLLSKKLGYNFIEEDIIQKVAEKVNVSKDFKKIYGAAGRRRQGVY